jgi:arylformamidase
VPAGIAVAVVEYALCPAVTLAELTDQVRRALIHLWKSADDYGLDRDRMLVSGHSAGGHLAGMMLATNWPDLDSNLPPDIIAGGLPISGIYDLEPIRHTPLNQAVRLTQGDIEPLSPMFLKPESRAPVTVAVGGLESLEFNRQAADLVRVWKDWSVDTRLLVVPEVNHYTIVFQLSEPEGGLFKEVLRLLKLS